MGALQEEEDPSDHGQEVLLDAGSRLHQTQNHRLRTLKPYLRSLPELAKAFHEKPSRSS